MRALSRRQLIAGGSVLALLPTITAGVASDEQYFEDALLPPPEAEIDYPVEPVNERLIPEEYRRQIVSYSSVEAPGTVVIDPGNRFLYYVLEGNQAIRYGIGVSRAGFAWSGEAVVGLKRRWPRWVPPREMVDRDTNARKWVNGKPGGPDNPLGARALYLFQGNADTLYRIHGTTEPTSIGTAVSSGCIRMTNPDVADLYERVPVGGKVIVLAALAEREPRRPRGFLFDQFDSTVNR
jgi:lipoprotein-anchoring transpeptidase ErfK/SrfK